MKNAESHLKMCSFVIFAVLLFSFISTGQSQTEPQTLLPEQTIEREMTGEETHRYKFDLKANEFFQVRVEQKGVDVALKLTDAAGVTLATMDSPNSKNGPETLSFIPAQAGSFILEVRGFDPKAEKGSYAISRIAARTAMANDKRRVEAERSFVEGMTARGTEGQGTAAIQKLESALQGWRELHDDYLANLTAQQINELKAAKPNALYDEAFSLFNQGTAESYRAALDKFQEASRLYQEINEIGEKAGLSLLASGISSNKLGEKLSALKFYEKALLFFRANKFQNWEAATLSNIGAVYSDLGEKQKAFEYYNQALPLRRQVSDKLGEATTLSNIGAVYSDLGEKQKALEYYNQALPLERQISDKSGEATTLNNIGLIYSVLGEKQKALGYYNQALPLDRQVDDKSGEATTLSNIGGVYSDLGENQKALEYYNQALPLERQVGDKSGEATTLNNIGGVYSDLGEKQKALEYYNQALPIKRQVDDRSGEATTLSNIGRIYSDLGEKQKALEYYNQALIIKRQVADKSGEAMSLNNIGAVYLDLGEKQKALEYYNQALLLERQIDDKLGEVTTLHNIGAVYSTLGEKQKALEYYNQALPLRRQIDDKLGEATTLNNIGLVYNDLGEKRKALDYYNQALPLEILVGDKSGTATTLNNIGGVYSDLGEKQKALEYYNQALPLRSQVGDRSGEATTLSNIGAVYSDLGEKQKALEYFQKSLPLSKAVGDKSGQSKTLDWLMFYWNSLNNLRFAVFYGKQAVNLLQELRTKIQGLDKEIQKTYLKSVEPTYRNLAGILIAQGRIAEAEQVLGMLKEEEYLSFLRRDDTVAKDLKGRISLSPDEKQAFDDYEKFSEEITRSAEEYGALEKKKAALPVGESLSSEDQKKYDALKGKYDAAVTVFNKYLDDLKIKFAKDGDKSNQVAAVESDTVGLLKKLDQPRTVIISTIAGEDRLNLIVTTSDIQKAHTVEIKAVDLNKLVTDFRAALKDPKVDPRPLGKQLYDKLFPKELEKDLENIKADTIIWSLDGTLRYVPMAALWDGRQYLVERYTNAVLTLASRDKLGADASGERRKWLALGVGVSKGFENFSPLPAVLQELCSVVDDAKKKEFCAANGETKNGAVKGLLLPDNEFTLKSFQDNLGKTAIVHIASHFSLNAGNEIDSYLLLGGGEQRRFSLDSLRKTRLDNVRLLTLSACNTAMTAGANSSGVEIEGFGALAQKQGVKTVLATLWSVADDSTRDLMTEFYRQLETGTNLGKADALRQAQLELLDGKYKSGEAAKKRGTEIIDPKGNKSEAQPPFKPDPNAPFAHPFYWSPFVLYGNWQ